MTPSRLLALLALLGAGQACRPAPHSFEIVRCGEVYGAPHGGHTCELKDAPMRERVVRLLINDEDAEISSLYVKSGALPYDTSMEQGPPRRHFLTLRIDPDASRVIILAGSKDRPERYRIEVGIAPWEISDELKQGLDTWLSRSRGGDKHALAARQLRAGLDKGPPVAQARLRMYLAQVLGEKLPPRQFAERREATLREMDRLYQDAAELARRGRALGRGAQRVAAR